MDAPIEKQANLENHDWIERAIQSASPFPITPSEHELLRAVIDATNATQLPGNATESEFYRDRRYLLAAAFDLLVAAEYYRSVSHLKWIYCPSNLDDPTCYYPYTNVCPHCVMSGDFHYSQAKKPQSGTIGVATSRLLALFFGELMTRSDKSVEILKASEPVDVIFIERDMQQPTALFAEIKSAPLTTSPLAVRTDVLTVEENDTSITVATHEEVSVNLYNSEISICIPMLARSDSLHWSIAKFPLGKKQGPGDGDWAYRGITQLLKDDKSFFPAYCSFWLHAFGSYAGRENTPVYWLTNACGPPRPRPASWPLRSSGEGYETVSDGKTSVGMDRTDDIKKSAYQVLKLGAEGKPASQYRYLVGVVSNIHAVRHFDEFLKPLKDIIWTKDETGNVKIASQLPPGTELFNLFDGIISLTETTARDPWVKSIFTF
ncbi:hypothetical protein HY229_08785 [Candidatus Acetothermia bacterium]|nr:hypothetical protein [Candidatus Acetothermia bacterium]MBI3644176.1 hypothetical protein [Candidatus Acetothermia bacterium]